MQEINFTHYESDWSITIDEEGHITKAFYNYANVPLTKLREERIYNHIKKEKLWKKH